MNHPLIEALKRGLIVSCQAPTDSPLHDPIIISAMAQSALNQGAVGVRLDSPTHIQAVRQKLPHAPIIGLWKQQIPGYDVYITPQFQHGVAVAEAGADIIAIDATSRKRPAGETLEHLIAKIHQELGKLVMADVDSVENGERALSAGADLIGTTLYGYTSETQAQKPPGFSLLQDLVKLGIPAICEGGISSPQQAKEALDLGAYAVVVGTDITGIDYKVKAYQAVFELSE